MSWFIPVLRARHALRDSIEEVRKYKDSYNDIKEEILECCDKAETARRNEDIEGISDAMEAIAIARRKYREGDGTGEPMNALERVYDCLSEMISAIEYQMMDEEGEATDPFQSSDDDDGFDMDQSDKENQEP